MLNVFLHHGRPFNKNKTIYFSVRFSSLTLGNTGQVSLSWYPFSIPRVQSYSLDQKLPCKLLKRWLCKWGSWARPKVNTG